MVHSYGRVALSFAVPAPASTAMPAFPKFVPHARHEMTPLAALEHAGTDPTFVLFQPRMHR
jgi:hypothetical protein